MKKLLVLGSLVFLCIGCAEKPIATSVVDLAGNQQIAGWKDKNSTEKVKTVCKEKVIYKKVEEKVKDTDGDGVIDKLDKCPNTPKGMPVDHNGCPIIATLRINFDFNKADVKKIYYNDIQKVALAIKSNPNIKKIEVAGHTDNIGSKEYNKKLSLKRAKAVADLLIKFGVNPKMIVIKGYGEDYPLVPNTTLTNRALNRRVEIINITN
ncbi:OmpA-OmpF porin, OOP family [Lebetimonas natsushimae]|uniref:OmpA-OmpF porin, OOP family n=1 Tax=Lebetimonas natsushimae TaxID=1936991 RepID=A0A292YFK8_9BACT|nr:OmpA family protein [Lebetimonas natsushimae]GAX87893.1 OmpA-OmpF porin, OOP family [Lebetimonas natsushimae]